METSDQATPNGIQYDEGLLQRAVQEVKSLAKPDIEFSGEYTPNILFHGFGNNQRAKKMFETASVNPDQELLWFTNTPQRAALAYGMRIEEEKEVEIAKAGLAHYKDENHPDWFKANGIVEDLKYILVVFPHEDTDLGKWVIDKHAPTAFADSQEYITNQDLPLAHTLIIRLDLLRPLIKDIESGGIKTKKEFMAYLGITEEDQIILRDKMKNELQK